MSPSERDPSDASSETGTTVVLERRPRPDVMVQPEEGGSIRVEVVGGPMDGESRRASKSSFTLGRGKTNDLPLPLDLVISTRHARIVREGQRYWLEDLQSRNGTYIGDERIDGRTVIGPGTVFVLGRTSLEFMPV